MSAGCIASTRPVVKIGLVGPFVGRYREVGEEVIYAVRLAVREANQAGGLRGYSVELMAYDDEGDPALAAQQARKISEDPQVAGVVGDWLESTTQAAAPVYDRAGIPFLATSAAPELDPAAFRLWYTSSTYAAAQPGAVCPLPCDPAGSLDWLKTHPGGAGVVGPAIWGLNLFPRLAGSQAQGVEVLTPSPLPADSSDPDFSRRYLAIAAGGRARFLAVLAYDAARLLLKAVTEAGGPPTPAAVSAALRRADFDGLSGRIRFDSRGNWQDAPVWRYRWDAGELRRP
jgi:ABC-type branched-subunit amino acid transport system substrate-binding protein